MSSSARASASRSAAESSGSTSTASNSSASIPASSMKVRYVPAVTANPGGTGSPAPMSSPSDAAFPPTVPTSSASTSSSKSTAIRVPRGSARRPMKLPAAATLNKRLLAAELCSDATNEQSSGVNECTPLAVSGGRRRRGGLTGSGTVRPRTKTRAEGRGQRTETRFVQRSNGGAGLYLSPVSRLGLVTCYRGCNTTARATRSAIRATVAADQLPPRAVAPDQSPPSRRRSSRSSRSQSPNRALSRPYASSTRRTQLSSANRWRWNRRTSGERRSRSPP